MGEVKELAVDIMPSHDLVLTWEEFGGYIGRKQQALNKEIYKRYVEDGDKWLLFLGCSDNKISLSPSLNFWRTLVQNFLKKLKKDPDIEDSRHRVTIVISTDELEDISDTAPLMTGREYLDMDFLIGKWGCLNKLFSGELAEVSCQ